MPATAGCTSRRAAPNLPDDTDRWRDKTVLAIPRGNIEKVVVSGRTPATNSH
ncbi:MAG: hypothetical protein R2834_22925 [Rhodothermales bacterium]